MDSIIFLPKTPTDFVVLVATLTSLWILYFLGTILRNLYFHPLSKFPGPTLWAATHLTNTYYILTGVRVYKVTDFHNKYGPVVRIAPNELSYVDEEAWKSIYAHKDGGQLKKYIAPRPDGLYGLFNSPTDEQHSRMRKNLAPAFSEKSIREREGIMQRYADVFVGKLVEMKGKKVDILEWFDIVTTDMTGYFAFGEGFHCLETETIHPMISIIYGLLKSIPTVTALLEFRLFRGFMWVKGEAMPHMFLLYRDIVAAAFKGREMRVKGGKYESEFPDYISYLSKNLETPKGLSTAELTMVGGDLLVAGSDTVATVLAGATYHLLTNPSKLKILMDEIRSAFKTEADITLSRVYSLKYNNAVINETMRIFPAGPETTPRVAGPNGNVVCGEYLPAGTIAGVFHWAAGHNKASWRDPDSFVPERWLDDERFKDDKRGVVQFFNTGPRNCIGQPLANAEMRLLLVRLLWSFDLELCEESKNWLDMQIFGLAYNKRALMVTAKPVAR